ncbi:cytochrome c biogenesis protein CcsA [Niabella soli]|uniref:Cytochrome C biogenesis protein n=1 Tax=Niabella soli DSM 19437 TaxID=929713 RepID=W0F142_9BACT|nr:cytochrome c biogenesis protein CcsA [Niabella soli]AHF15071.1 cytochrome C biogenesis protein [Niabella soli DSM 19437]
MNYIGENLLPGQAGHFFIILSLVASFVASFSYLKVTRSQLPDERRSWLKIARISFFIEAFSVLVIFATLFHILYHHLFEYKYAWQHSSRSLELKYILSAFWEGQEGSTLLWTFWHCVLGLIVIKRDKEWEAPVMMIVSFAQFFLASMILGIYIFDVKIGSNPFVLLRESGVLDNAPVMHVGFNTANPIRPDYMTMIKDGNDLNPLLQNYWMTIHPPILFLGFASTLFPFAYAMAALWTGKTKEWINKVLPWSLFSVALLGLGIMMGAKWAYESLNFGGYWAWDPVENASLVPWLMMVSGVHTLLIYKHTGFSLRSTFLFFGLSFLFILYSTFLTKSGVLGDASVHAFADIGMNGQLFLFLLVFAWLMPLVAATKDKQRWIIAAITAALSIGTYFLNDVIPGFPLYVILGGIITFIVFMNKQVPAVKKEESASSREFWMFIGSLVLFLSSLIIIFQTSLPVFNKLYKINTAPGENNEFAYNQIQVLVAIIIGILTAVSQYFRYKATPQKIFFKKIALPGLISAVIAAFILLVVKISYNKEGMGFLINIWIALVAGVFAVVANLSYMLTAMKGNIKNSGASIAHFGFGLVLVGILLSSGKKEILSLNTSGIAIPFEKNSKEKTGENLTLVKGVPTRMGDYDVTYVGDSAHPKKALTYFKIYFKSPTDSFTLHPNAFINYKGNEGLMANPSARHYWDHDVFTYVSALPDPEKNKDTAQFVESSKKIGDTIYYSRGFIVLEKLAGKDNLPVAGFDKSDTGYTAALKIQSINGPSYQSDLLTIKGKGQTLFQSQDTVMAQSLVLTLNDVNNGVARIGVKESSNVMEYVTLKAYKFPYINVLWGGVVITVLGTLIAMIRRLRLNRLKRA